MLKAWTVSPVYWNERQKSSEVRLMQVMVRPATPVTGREKRSSMRVFNRRV